MNTRSNKSRTPLWHLERLIVATALTGALAVTPFLAFGQQFNQKCYVIVERELKPDLSGCSVNHSGTGLTYSCSGQCFEYDKYEEPECQPCGPYTGFCNCELERSDQGILVNRYKGNCVAKFFSFYGCKCTNINWEMPDEAPVTVLPMDTVGPAGAC